MPEAGEFLKIQRMRPLRIACLAAVVASGQGGCGGGQGSPAPTAPTSSPAAAQFSTHQSTRFTFRYTAIDSATVAQTAAAVEEEYDRILDDLGVTQMPMVVVTLYPDLEAMRRAVAPVVGTLPSFATALVTGVDAVHSLSPNLAATWSYRDAVTALVHEFAHCVSLRLNPTFANSPRWLWESVALLEALQYNSARTFPIVSAGPLPSLTQLNSLDNTAVYDVGAWLGHFIAETRGWETYRALIRANGDLGRVLSTNEAAFLSEWAAFVRTFIH